MGVPQSDPDLPLGRALQAGDDRALNELVRKYQEPLFGFICRYIGDEETAQDILQETFVRLYSGFAGLSHAQSSPPGFTQSR
jgi:DNA-directed RNA polymerase specialized sigma24 family protein